MTADKRNILTEQKTRQAYTTAGDGRLAKTSPTYVVYLVPSSSGAPATVGHISFPNHKNSDYAEGNSWRKPVTLPFLFLQTCDRAKVSSWHEPAMFLF